MNITTAINSRISCRAYLAKPVPKQTLLTILETAGRAPSGGNLQPWLVHALTGAPLAQFLAIVRDKRAADPAGEGLEYDIYPPMQSVMLLAREQGPHTCPQEAWAVWHKTIAEFLQLPPQIMLFCGMALGYMDESAPINSLRTERAALEEFATLRGF